MSSGYREARVNIVSWDGGGLGTDIDVLTETLRRLGCKVTFKGKAHRHARNRLHSLLTTARVLLAQRVARFTGRQTFDINIFIESVFPEYLPQARTNALFVNPEWFRDENTEYLARLDWILCKTPSAIGYFADAPATCRLTAFTSPDKWRSGVQRDAPLRCLHISGASSVKGTEVVVDAWARNPGWPELTVVRRRRYGGEEAPPLAPLPNVRYETEYLSDEQLTLLQNSCAVHVIPSQAEGYGHIIAEGMSCGAVVVTTDAPPMNELVTAERGVLVRVARSEPMRRSQRHFVDLDDLEARLTSVFAMSPAQREALGRRAREWYEGQGQRFERHMDELLTEVVDGRRGRS